MIPASFEYHAPSSVDEAIQLLGRYDGEAKLIAGGHSLLPMLKLRLVQPEALIDLGRIPSFSYIARTASRSPSAHSPPTPRSGSRPTWPSAPACSPRPRR